MNSITLLRNGSDWVALIIPTLIFLEIKLVGRLFVSEIFLFCLLPLLLSRFGYLLRSSLPRLLILLCISWLSAQILTDIIRETPFEDWTRGWSKIIFLAINFSSIYLLINHKENRFILFALGLAIGQALSFYFNPNIYAQDYPWKFGYGMSFTLVAIIFIQVCVIDRSKLMAFLMIAFLSSLNFYMGFRSLGAICMMVLILTILVKGKFFRIKDIRFKTIGFLFIFGFIFSFGVMELYGYAAGDGWLGLQAQELYLQQASGGFGFLLGARAELFGSLQAIFDSPIIGHGSWARDGKYIEIMMDALREHGYNPYWIDDKSDLIPTHSYIFGAWVEAGIMGALFWMSILCLICYALISLFVKDSNLIILISFAGFNLLWDILFSPLGAEGRLYSAFFLALIIHSLVKLKNPHHL
jgi:hypothetical protein